MECRFCRKSFSKGEHLRRHERSHTGARPFVCKECKRAFSRQDSMLRHERLHTRTENSGYPASQAGSVAEPITPESMHRVDFGNSENDASAIPSIPTRDQMLQDQQPTNTGLDVPAPATDLDFELMWPDSEHLFQSIMSPNALAFPSETALSMDYSGGTPSSFDERAPSIGAIPSGGNHKAVRDVSTMIANLSSSVTAAAESSSIDSVFLDECLHMFFVRFIPTFPVLHRATFVFGDCIHPLLLNAIAIGSLYLGPKNSVAKGEVLWRLAHTAVATSWQTLITHCGPYDACQGVQLIITALLGQVYGSLSKNRSIRTMSQAFHAQGLTWANYCGMFDSEPYRLQHLPCTNAPTAEKEYQWRVWVAREIQHRALLAHYMLDGLIAQMSGKATTARHSSNQLPLPCNEAAFFAETAEEWLHHLQAQQGSQPNFRSIFRLLFTPVDDRRWLGYSYSAFSLRVLLEGLQSLLSDCDEDGEAAVGSPSKTEITRALGRLYDNIAPNLALSSVDRLEALLRWHAICLDAVVDSSTLCRHVCTKYNIEQHIWPHSVASTSEPDLVSWANTDNARRALLHALAIQDIVEQLPRGRAHAIHMPSSLFAAATVYSVFLLAGIVNLKLPTVVDWKDVVHPVYDPCIALAELAGTIASSGTTRFIRGEATSNIGIGTTTRNVLYEFNSMQKLFGCLATQWGVAVDMERLVDKWITLCH